MPSEDYEQIEKVIKFKHQEAEVPVEINLFNNDLKKQTEDGNDEEEISKKFYITMYDAKPAGVKLSKKNLCLIEIVPETGNEEEEEQK